MHVFLDLSIDTHLLIDIIVLRIIIITRDLSVLELLLGKKILRLEFVSFRVATSSKTVWFYIFIRFFWGNILIEILWESQLFRLIIAVVAVMLFITCTSGRYVNQSWFFLQRSSRCNRRKIFFVWTTNR